MTHSQIGSCVCCVVLCCAVKRVTAADLHMPHQQPADADAIACQPLLLLTRDRTSFKDVGKGWYNLAESNYEAYRFSKLRRFLGLVRFGMEDSLRYLIEGSIAKFVAFMKVRGLVVGREGSASGL